MRPLHVFMSGSRTTRLLTFPDVGIYEVISPFIAGVQSETRLAAEIKSGAITMS